jgi:NAD(P)H-quinone oxidoreductase subunit 5
MSPLLPDLPPLRAALLCATPLVYGLTALASGLFALSPRSGWQLARWSSAIAGVASLLSLGWLVAAGSGLMHSGVAFALGSAPVSLASLRSDALGCTMLLLVSFIGWVIVGYSQTYLDGERGQLRYIRGLMLTLASVAVLVITNSLLMLAATWIVTSLALHGLLTFFDRRPQALIAAHKKFLASRVADLFLLCGIGLLGSAVGTLEIDQAMAAARALQPRPAVLDTIALLFAASALLKCAQLPVHGWLIQVMEAPTPVSALLHAGVVNLGGFLLIRLGTIVTDGQAAQALLVLVGSVTAIVASLVMTTRISIKVSLAWSTCAQMGFMMMQCGLGLLELALLHLVAHSLYKAHAFLSAGGAVEQNRLQQMTPPAPVYSFGAWLLGGVVGAVLVGSAAMLWGLRPGQEPPLWAMAGIVALALAPLLAGRVLPADGFARWGGLLAAFAVALTYFGLHVAFGRWLGAQPADAARSPVLIFWALGCFCLLFLVQGAVRTRPHGALARALYPTLFSGLYLDELFTRLTFRIWPARLSPAGRGTVTPPIQSSARGDSHE